RRRYLSLHPAASAQLSTLSLHDALPIYATQVEGAPVYLGAGVTTVRDMGNEFEFITALRDSIAAHRSLGPRLLLAGLIDGSGPRSEERRVGKEGGGRAWRRSSKNRRSRR